MRYNLGCKRPAHEGPLAPIQHCCTCQQQGDGAEKREMKNAANPEHLGKYLIHHRVEGSTALIQILRFDKGVHQDTSEKFVLQVVAGMR